MSVIRIISGKYRSRHLVLPPLDPTVRPTQDKIRGAIFSAINDFDNKIILDLFAGSGAYGFESISRGAKKVYFNDINAKCCLAIKKSAEQLDCQTIIEVFNLHYKKCLNLLKNTKFDIVFLDPPYKDNINEEIIDFITKNNLLNENGIIVAEQETAIKEIENYNLKTYKYSYKRVGIYKKGE